MTRFDLARDWQGLPPPGSHMTLELKDGELYLVGQYPAPNETDYAQGLYGQAFVDFFNRMGAWVGID